MFPPIYNHFRCKRVLFYNRFVHYLLFGMEQRVVRAEEADNQCGIGLKRNFRTVTAVKFATEGSTCASFQCESFSKSRKIL